MKAIYRRHLHATLDNQLPARLHGYVLRPLKLSKLERRAATLFTGSRLYSRSMPEGTLFIHLIPHRRQEQLLAEIGWSISDRFPIELSSHGPLTNPANELDEAEWLIDFGTLYHRRYHLGHPPWEVWKCSVDAADPSYVKVFMEEDAMLVTEDEARARAEAALATCLNDLENVAIPYLNEWIESRRRTS